MSGGKVRQHHPQSGCATSAVMKFGVLFASGRLEQWSNLYLDYEGIKSLLDQYKESSCVNVEDAESLMKPLLSPYARTGDTGHSPVDMLDLSAGEISDPQIFWRLLHQELRKVNKGFKSIARDLFSTMDYLQIEVDTLTVMLPSERLEFRKQFTKLYRKACLLVNFSMLNGQAFSKIAKKVYKVTQCDDGRTELLAEVENAEFLNTDSIQQLMRDILHVFADEFEDGNLEKSKVLLLTKMTNSSYSTSDILLTGIKVGLTLGLGLWILLLSLETEFGERDTNEFDLFIKYSPLYRCMFMFVVLVWLWGLCVYTWTKFRINFTFVFEFDPYSRLTHYQIWDEASNLSIVFLFNYLIFSYTLASSIRYNFVLPFSHGVFPFSLIMFVGTRLLFPGEFMSNWSSRRFVLKSLWHIVRAPFGRVRFFDSFLADILTSMVKPILDLVSGLSGMLFNVYDLPIWTVGIFSALPLWFRFHQCLNRYYQTGNRFPNLPNALKYAISHTVVIVSSFHPSYSHYDNSQEWDSYRFIWLSSILVSTLYVFSWDVLMDWGLYPESFFHLRNDLMYSKKRYYYWAIVSNFFLRFAWTLTLIPSNINPFFVQTGPHDVFYYKMVFLPLVSFLEIFRRAQWALLRGISITNSYPLLTPS